MCVMTNDLIGKRVKLTEEFATEYYYDKPYVNKVLIVVDLILSYKEDDIKKEFGYNRVVLKDDDGNIYDDDIEDLRSGSVFNWTYPDESGIEVDVELFQGDEEA